MEFWRDDGETRIGSETMPVNPYESPKIVEVAKPAVLCPLCGEATDSLKLYETVNRCYFFLGVRPDSIRIPLGVSEMHAQTSLEAVL